MGDEALRFQHKVHQHLAEIQPIVEVQIMKSLVQFLVEILLALAVQKTKSLVQFLSTSAAQIGTSRRIQLQLYPCRSVGQFLVEFLRMAQEKVHQYLVEIQ